MPSGTVNVMVRSPEQKALLKVKTTDLIVPPGPSAPDFHTNVIVSLSLYLTGGKMT